MEQSVFRRYFGVGRVDVRIYRSMARSVAASGFFTDLQPHPTDRRLVTTSFRPICDAGADTGPRTATIVHGEIGHIACCLECARILKVRLKELTRSRSLLV